MTSANTLRTRIRENYLADEASAVKNMIEMADISEAERATISNVAADMIEQIRRDDNPGLMEQFLGEYGLSTNEGVALMCLAEALLRVPDAETIDALIQDKIAPADWGKHLGHSSSSLVNASTWALMLTGQVLKDDSNPGIVSTLHDMVRRLGEPVVRTAVSHAMREMGQQFVLGETISRAIKRGQAMEERGYTYSYDMLGEAARTEADARRYHLAYADAIGAIARNCRHNDIRQNPGISVKLSALYPRYEYTQREQAIPAITARLIALLTLAKSANMGLNIDAEEADRLDLSLDIIEAALSEPALAEWDGFGVVVQAYSKRAPYVIDWLHDLAERLDRKIMVRLVKGAYWDAEIKRAQVLGIDGFPVFTRKVNTDISYIACARKLLGMTDRIYPQFATHNAHTVASVLHLAGETNHFEFQRLHGMGEPLHDVVLRAKQTRCRIYAPVGAHEDLLAYLVRRLLENGANSSFVHQIVDTSIDPNQIAADPIAEILNLDGDIEHPKIARPAAIFLPGRRNAKGWDFNDPMTIDTLNATRSEYRKTQWNAALMLGNGSTASGQTRPVINPFDPSDIVGHVLDATPADVDSAYGLAADAFQAWCSRPVGERADLLRAAADAYEVHAPELMALAAREAGKTLPDGIAEVREAVDFLRFYAAEAERLEDIEPAQAMGTFACISPWNFPLAIFTGPIAAALAAGNTVIAKPAEQTCLIAARAVELMHEVGIPKAVVQLLPGDGPGVGGPLVSDPRLAGVCFTGSTETAQAINRTMAKNANPTAPLIAETGGLNAMILDSTALAEQGVRDVVMSAFQSAGQRCSAARLLYIQKDVEERTMTMLKGAMETLTVGDPWCLSSDLGPVIDADAHADLTAYIEEARASGRVVASLDTRDPMAGHIVPPTIVKTNGINDMAREMFGPILHVATFEAKDLQQVVRDINARQYGLTLGIHTRVDERVQEIVGEARVGNIYVNRNQIGAVVNSQPFGGEGLSGTGPKAGGPMFLRRFRRPVSGTKSTVHLGEMDLPGPTGESNRYKITPRGRVVCVGELGTVDGGEALQSQCAAAKAWGNEVVEMPGRSAAEIASMDHIETVMAFGSEDELRDLRQRLSERDGPLVLLTNDPHDVCSLISERTLCIDTTAAGGNASLLAEAA